MRAIGKRPALKNRAVCNSCFDFMEKHHVTVETATAADLDPGLPTRDLELKGKLASTRVVSLMVGQGPTLAAS